MHQILKTTFGYDDFRPLQKDIMDHVLANRDALVLMSTGGGKSLCYQLPALVFEGMTIVISPLIALMKDQVDALKANGVAAEFLNSTLSQETCDKIQERAQNGRVKILYLAPERLAINSFKTFLAELKVSLIAIDEAHCISEWGHDFRPDYRNLVALRHLFPQAPVIALTATATETVRKDIVTQLHLRSPKIFLSSFNRPNLTYTVIPKKNALQKLTSLLAKQPGESAIVYCFSRKETESVATDLRSAKFNALPYHAGLNPELRKRTQEKFLRDETQIIVATIAFGMGIDKPNVRLVVHYDLPKSIEGYFQETGRAGRDGLPSECVLFYSYGDKIKHDYFINQIVDDKERKVAQLKLAMLLEYCGTAVCRRWFLLNYFNEKFTPLNCASCDICLQTKEENDFTALTRKILAAVIHTGERFGANHVVDILRGSHRKSISDRGHDKLPVFGIAHEVSADEIKHVIKHLQIKKLLVKKDGEYPTLGVSDLGRTFLSSGQSLSLPKYIEDADAAVSEETKTTDYDHNLFELLRGLRKQLANEQGVPPFVVFGDTSLREMAKFFPQKLESFANISGVGREKLTRYGKIFVSIIRDYSIKHNLSEKSLPERRPMRERSLSRPGSTFQETLDLLGQKLSLEEIAKRRQLTIGTIIGHLEKFDQTGQKLDLHHLTLPTSQLAALKKAVDSGTRSLFQLHALLGNELSYEDIRLGRLLLKYEAG